MVMKPSVFYWKGKILFMYYYQSTKYPKLFEDTYWGRFNMLKDPADSKVIENRNKFIEEYKIIKNLRRSRRILFCKLYDTVRIDHLELYKTEDNKILIVQSPYEGQLRNLTKTEEKILESFKEIYPIYHLTARTYIKEYIK